MVVILFESIDFPVFPIGKKRKNPAQSRKQGTKVLPPTDVDPPGLVPKNLHEASSQLLEISSSDQPYSSNASEHQSNQPG
jgi:hypothetical protein